MFQRSGNTGCFCSGTYSGNHDTNIIPFTTLPPPSTHVHPSLGTPRISPNRRVRRIMKMCIMLLDSKVDYSMGFLLEVFNGTGPYAKHLPHRIKAYEWCLLGHRQSGSFWTERRIVWALGRRGLRQFNSFIHGKDNYDEHFWYRFGWLSAEMPHSSSRSAPSNPSWAHTCDVRCV